MAFGSRLRRLRENRGLSQAQLAEKAGVPIDSVQNWEQGRTRPRLEALGKLAGALGASVDALVTPGPEEKDEPRPRGRPRKADAEAPGSVAELPPPQRKPARRKPPRPRGG